MSIQFKIGNKRVSTKEGYDYLMSMCAKNKAEKKAKSVRHKQTRSFKDQMKHIGVRRTGT
jgi:hypothetical protein